MTQLPTTPGGRPRVLLLMSEATFALQFREPQLDRLRRLAVVGDLVRLDALDGDEGRARLAEADVLVTSWGAPPITLEQLDAAPRLRAVLHAAGSVRGLLPDAAWDRGIVVTSAADENARPVAEYTLAAIILAGKRAPFLAAEARTRRGGWSFAVEREDLTNRGRTVGIVGWSRIGRRTVELLDVLETDAVLVADPTITAEDLAGTGAELVDLAELLRRSDIVSLHAPALPETHHLIGAAELALMPDGATLVNTARGALVDTAALEREAAAGRLSAILDVTDPEPLPATSVLYDLPNVMLTPHIAGSLGSEARRMSDHALDELERLTLGQPVLAPVTREHLVVGA
ncbi:hydroxyacid dehydrogenase [Cellulomonas fengjieae]|uniref:hydroxyacid dehydrogenase n=1 Tax=Cellulomonas fengjieae TaxID=2819978 RepID=UPI0027DEAB64|nr:hydroxyacid dehydrogenase [Cellulomonas fengjieae]